MKILAALILTVTLFLSGNSFAEAINGEFKPDEDITHIKEGDLIEGTLRFWPIENADLTQFKKLEKTALFNAFYLAQVTELGISQNNADVVEMKALFIVKSAKPQSIQIFKYNESPIELSLNNIKIDELQNKNQDYFILDQALNKSYMLIVLGCILALLVIIAIFKIKKIKELIIGLRPDADKKARKKYDAQFRSANKREDFELIYKDKDIWLKLLEVRAPAHNEFFKILNQFQYKKDWSNEDYNEVRTSFDVIRRSFEK